MQELRKKVRSKKRLDCQSNIQEVLVIILTDIYRTNRTIGDLYLPTGALESN
jgi:hypothetical protein